jgi:hypothetical protein
MLLAMFLCISIYTSMSAYARLGEDFAAFKIRILKTYDSAGQQNENFFFKLKLTPRQQQIAPGYAVGITTTVNNGKVIGESMACIVGDNHPLGYTLAALDAFTFTCEASGKPLPQEQKQAQLEFGAFAKIVQHALDGTPQSYSYPGYPCKINILLDKSGRLIIACSPQEPQSAAPTPQTLPPPPADMKIAPPAPAPVAAPGKPTTGAKSTPTKKTSHN